VVATDDASGRISGQMIGCAGEQEAVRLHHSTLLFVAAMLLIST
jgi:hypothetical protein